MPIGARLYVKNSLEILSILLEKGEEVQAWRSLDYAVHESAFESIHPICSRKIFRDRKAEFLASKFIKPVRSTGNKKYYSITPLGIVWLFHHEKIMSEFYTKRVFRFVSHFYKDFRTRKKPIEDYPIIELNNKVWQNLRKGFTRNQLFGLLTRACRTVKIQDNQITFTFPISVNVDCNVGKFHIDSNGQIHMDYLFDIEVKREKISEEEFYELISRHVILSFFLFLIIAGTEISYNRWKSKKSWKPNKPIKWLESIDQSFDMDILEKTKWFGRDLMEVLYENNNKLEMINTLLEDKTKKQLLR